MALDWKTAQENEKAFWDQIYVKRDADIGTYTAISDVQALEFAVKCCARHRFNPLEGNGKLIADLGCGPYGIVKGLASINHGQFKKIVGVDPLMNHYRRYGIMPERDDVLLINSKVEDFMSDISFDVVHSSNVMDHVDDPLAFARKAHELLKPGGLFMVSVHCVFGVGSLLRPGLKYIDRNHPHHFTPTFVDKKLSELFANTELTYVATTFEDQPEFSFTQILRDKNIRSVKRYLSNLLIASYFFNCIK